MKHQWHKNVAFFLSMVMLLSPFFTASSFGTTCTDGTANPVFLATSGIPPNLLLMIDNSASMYDMAYTEDTGCFADNFSTGTTYAGYFDSASWYEYDLTNEKFTKLSSAPTVTGYSYYNTSYVGISVNSTPAVTAFVATGNLLNWVTSSKMDIEKKILTGGKYDASNGWLEMETRGCLNRKFVRKVAMQNLSGTTYYLTLGVRRPEQQTYDAWEKGTTYAVGDIVSYAGILYQATSAGTSTGTSPESDTAPLAWSIYNLTSWTRNVYYPPGSVVTDPSKYNTVDKGTLYITSTGGTSSSTATGVDDDTVDWEPYYLTHIEVFQITTTGFNMEACQDALDEMAGENRQGVLKTYISSCMDYTSGTDTQVENAHAAFNHSIHNCWYYTEHGSWAPGEGPVNSIKTACENLYGFIAPWEITTDDRGYVCSGYNITIDSVTYTDGYVGRCWDPGTDPTCTCAENKLDSAWESANPTLTAADCTPAVDATDNCCRDTSSSHWDCTGGSSGTWISDECIDQALKDYCGIMEIPEVADFTDQAATSSVAWNVPAVLVDSGVVAQMGDPLLIMKGRVTQSTAPTGLVQEYDDDIRMGAMAFNTEGSKSECSATDPHILYNCTNTSNRDGGSVISEIDQSAAHTTSLVSAINDIKANTWTPLAEAMYNAIGYYTQKTSMRLDSNDFDTTTDPITAWCQANNVLLITEGASTADLNSTVNTFASTVNQKDTDTIDQTDCNTLSASTYFDDLTYYAKNGSIYSSQLNGYDKQNIRTHIVTAGSPRDEGTNECNPNTLLTDAASNGGTSLYQADDLSQLETTLREAFEAIRTGAAAGSAASVISASRGGEGAIYQAIFWPSVDISTTQTVDWIGEVHALLIDENGYMYEDTNGNKSLDAGDSRIYVYFDADANKTKACFGSLSDDGDACTGTSKDIDELHYLWSATKWLSEVTDTDILVDRSTYVSNAKKRYIFTWNDLDNDGEIDSSGTVGDGELFFLDPTTDWSALTTSATRGPAMLDFTVQTSAEVNEIIKWIRGLDDASLRSRQVPADFDLDGTDTTITWRLGDVIHSTPVAVSRPSEGFQYIYKDTSYAAFAKKYQYRRHMVYFGANDGMLHAINGGFYDESNKKFSRVPVGSADAETTGPELGAEMWAYVPYNLLPHLKCLTETGYVHKYYVDLRPRIFDARIFSSDTTHPNGWGTIMVAGMRFGGYSVIMRNLDLDNNGFGDFLLDNRTLMSTFVVFDITDPENPPTLLGEYTYKSTNAQMGAASAIPTIVTMKDGSSHEWYLVMGSGPTSVDGTSDQNAKIGVIDLKRVVSGDAFRIPNATPSSSTNYAGVFSLSGSPNGFVSNLTTVDFDLEEDYMADVVYFGTVEGSAGSWGGKMYRLVTRKVVSGVQDASLPNEWSVSILIDAGQPVVAPANVGSDGTNFWVYFGTGRFFNTTDKTDATAGTDTATSVFQSMYGIKEPKSYTFADGVCSSSFTWETVEKTASGATPGSLGLLRTDQILVKEADTQDTATLSCSNDGATPSYPCLPIVDGSKITNFAQLIDYIAGEPCKTTPDYGTDGWYRNFSKNAERNLGQAALLGGLLTYTTYVPYSDDCLAEGLSYLFGVYFGTGTAWYRAIFEDGTLKDADGNVGAEILLGKGQALTPNVHKGQQVGKTDFIQTSTGEIVEVPQINLPVESIQSGRSSWKEVD